MNTYKLSYACNTDDRHWENECGTCYREVATCTAANWRDAFVQFKAKYPAIMANFGVSARVAVSLKSNGDH